MTSTEIDWTRLDKSKFFLYGAALFSGVTSALYPISVVKTRQMALEGVPKGLQGAKQVTAAMWRVDGVRGFYRGFGVTVVGILPARMVYLTVLEMVKSETGVWAQRVGLSPTASASVCSGVAGGAASLATQAVLVPVDVISQRLMVGQDTHHPPLAPAPPASASASASASAAAAARHHAPSSSAMATAPSSGSGSGSGSSSGSGGTAGMHHHSEASSTSSSPSAQQHQRANVSSSNSTSSSSSAAASRLSSQPQQRHHGRVSGVELAVRIVRAEGLRGLYRGFGMSLATYAPSSAVWWGCYGTYQKLLWGCLGSSSSSSSSGAPGSPVDTGRSGHHQGQEQLRQHPDQQQQLVPLSRKYQVLAVQTVSALMSGTTAAWVTNPLDLVKTRLQVYQQQQQQQRYGGRSDHSRGHGTTVSAVLRRILREDGWTGLWRGIAPRMFSSAMWGTCMVTAYEFLKRVCELPPEGEHRPARA